MMTTVSTLIDMFGQGTIINVSDLLIDLIE